MTIPRLVAMNKYWANNPPMHVMAAAYFGIGKKAETKPKQESMNELFAFCGFDPNAPSPNKET